MKPCFTKKPLVLSTYAIHKPSVGGFSFWCRGLNFGLLVYGGGGGGGGTMHFVFRGRSEGGGFVTI
jgi:hypothetical protein